MPHIRVILQARTTSTRLAAKSLLPIGGFPLAILCAKRLQNTGREVVLATSSDHSDDYLSRVGEKAGINVCRGSLDNVLNRFVNCANDLSDNDIIIRATADNPLPDGAFVDLLIEKFERLGVTYLSTTNAAFDGLPCGMSLEAFTVRSLRDAGRLAKSQYEREHVTPLIRERAAPGSIEVLGQAIEGNRSDLRCTVDTLDDFLRMAEIFSTCADPIQMPWSALLDLLPTSEAEPERLLYGGKLTNCGKTIMLGTAQLGGRYGIANQSGQPSDDEARSILDYALTHGITWVDTARSYGDSEARIGSALDGISTSESHVVTKLASLSGLADDAKSHEVANAIDSSIFRSCHALRRQYLDVVMFHRASDVARWNGAAIEHIEELIDEGVVGELGASVYSPEEAIRCIADERIRHLQIPFNLLDGRWTGGAFQAAVNQRPDLKVHVRSVFLQGLLVSDESLWPEWVASRKLITRQIGEMAAALSRRNTADLCMAYVRAFAWVTTIVLGVERREQLEELLQSAKKRPLSLDEVAKVKAALTNIPERLLDPSKW